MRALDLGEVLWNPPATAIGSSNAILSDSAPKRVDGFAGSLSIKFMLAGSSVWTVGRRRFRVDGDAFLVLNHGTVYSLERLRGEPTESFCPFFARGFVEAAGYVASASQATLLDAPEPPRSTTFEVAEQIHVGDARVTPCLRALASAIRNGVATPLGVETEFAALALRLVASRDRIAAERERVPATRSSTRAELHARLQRARERVHDELGSRLTLASLGRTAGLSPHHLHRAFRAVYGESLHRYQTRLRLERAGRLLRTTDRSVTEVCAAVGYESLGSFSSLFRRAHGCSPAAWRRAAREIPTIREAPAKSGAVGWLA